MIWTPSSTFSTVETQRTAASDRDTNGSCQVKVNHHLDPLGVSCLMLSTIKHPSMHVGCMLVEKQSHADRDGSASLLVGFLCV